MVHPYDKNRFLLLYPSPESSRALLGRAWNELARFLILPHKLQDLKKIDLFDYVRKY